jgi:DNA polymerase III epsilon subunit-like protein
MLKVLELCFSCMGKSKEMLEKQNDWRQVYPEEQSMDDTFATCLGYLANFQRRICLSRCAEKDIPMTDVLTNTHKLSSNHSTREPAKAKKNKSLDTDENEDSCYLISPCEISFEEENDR